MAFTKVRGPGITTTDNYRVGVITASSLISRGGIKVGPSDAGGYGVGIGATFNHAGDLYSVGVITATKFVGNGDGLTNTGAVLSAASGSQRVIVSSLTSGIMTTAATDGDLFWNATTNTLSAEKISVDSALTAATGTFSGNVSVGGVLQYEDVVNVDSVGVVTARAGIFVDDSITHIGDTNTKIRFPGADTFTVETAGGERLRIDSSGRLGIGDNSPTVAVSIKNTAPKIKFIDSDATGTPESLVDGSGGDIIIDVDKDDEKGSTLFAVKVDGSEKLRIASSGQLGIGGANYGSSGQVLTSQGGSSAPQWAAAQGGLDYFTESENTSSPNNSVAANRLIVKGSGSNIDYVASPKGTGANLSQLPDSGTGGGNKRGTYATDWQKERDNANQVASGNYSSIGGGRKNRASGLYSHIGGGQQNTATGHADCVAGGEDCDATGGNSAVGGGYLCRAQASGATVAGGAYNTAASSYSTVVGGARGKTRWYGHTVLGGHGDTVMGSNGGQQAGITVYQRQTTDATPTTIATNSNSSGDTLRLVTLPNNSAYGFTITLVAAVTGGGNSSMWKYQGLIKRGANAGSTPIVGSVVKDRIAYDSGASAWDADAAADTTNGSIKITVTGQASTTIRWLARIETTELTYS